MMASPKNRIYLLLSVLFIFGYLWVLFWTFLKVESKRVFCPIKAISGYPCPACGSTRSIVHLIQGDFEGAMHTNPLGLLTFTLLLIGPWWLLYDFIFKKETLWQGYNKVESFLKRKKVAVFVIILVLANWFWNLSKGL